MYFHMLGYHSLSSSDRAAALLSVAEAALPVAVELFQQGEQLRLFSGVQAGEHLFVPLHALGLSATAELPRGVTPEQAAQFAARTGADSLAAPLRTADVEGRPCIDLTALAAFRDALPGMALVLHGVHGLPPQQLQTACAQGVSRVSFSKDIQAAELAALQGVGEGTVWERAEAGVRSALLRLLPLCGCQNRA